LLRKAAPSTALEMTIAVVECASGANPELRTGEYRLYYYIRVIETGRMMVVNCGYFCRYDRI
jgi:hypothetical protein